MNEGAPQVDSHYLAIIEKLADVTATLRSLEASVREKREDISHAHERINKVDARVQILADTTERNLANVDRALVGKIEKTREDLDDRTRQLEMRVFAAIVLCSAIVGIVVPVGLHYMEQQNDDSFPYPPAYQNPQRKP
jgi:hypothetical protein